MSYIDRNIDVKLSDSLNSWTTLSGEKRDEILKVILASLEQKDYPVYESDTEVILFYYGSAKDVRLLSDITGWTDPIRFTQLESTGMFYLKLELESDARIEYQLIVDGNIICDPFNKFRSLNGLGALTELAMPCYNRHPYFNEYLYGKQGSFEGLIKQILPSGALSYEHEIHVFLPPEYNSKNKYPVLYFHDGPDYIRFALAPYTIERMISENKILPCIAVFVTPPNLHQPAIPNRSNEYGMNDDYVSFFCNELVPFIDSNYSTIKSPHSRLVVGDSYAGLISLYIGFRNPEVFANIYSQSGYFSFQNDSLIKLFGKENTKQLNIFMDIGTYEEKVGADFLPSSELNFITANRRMQSVLQSKGYNFLYREYHEGHTWGNWRRHLIDALIHFFSLKEK